MPKKKTTRKKSEVEKQVEETVGKAEEALENLGEEIGKISHYFAKIGVAVVELAKQLKVGDKIRVKGMTTDFEQLVKSIQIEHKEVEKAGKGKAVGIKVKEKVRGNDKVYKVGE